MQHIPKGTTAELELVTFQQALAAAGVPFEYHVYPDGVHGLSLCNKETEVGNPVLNSPVCARWITEAIRYVTEFKA